MAKQVNIVFSADVVWLSSIQCLAPGDVFSRMEKLILHKKKKLKKNR